MSAAGSWRRWTAWRCAVYRGAKRGGKSASLRDGWGGPAADPGARSRSAGWDYGAIYHSHTRSAPTPSQTDINMALVPGVGPLWPGSIYIIVGLAEAEPEVRAFRIESDTPEEVALSVG